MSPQTAEEQIQNLPIDRVHRDPDQPRREFDGESLEGLAASLKGGQLYPIRVRLVEDRFLIVDGERRWRACKLAGLATIAAVVEGKDLCAAEVLHRQLIANCQREDLTPFETAVAIDRVMKETGWNASTVAEHLGFSVSKVTRLLDALELPEAIRPRVQSGRIGMSAASELARIDDPALQADLAARVAAGTLTRNELTAAVKAHKTGVRREQAGSACAPGRADDGLTGAECSQNNGADGPQPGPARATAKLQDGRAVTVSGVVPLTLSTFIDTLEKVLTKGRIARTKNYELRTFLKMLKDEANA